MQSWSRFARIEKWLSITLDLEIRKHSSKNPIWNGNEKSDILEASEDPARQPFHQWHAQYQHGATKHHPGVDYKNYFIKPVFIALSKIKELADRSVI